MNLLAQAIGTPIVINKNSISIDAFEVAGMPEGFKIWWGQILKSTKNLEKSFKSSEWLKLQMEFQSKLNGENSKSLHMIRRPWVVIYNLFRFCIIYNTLFRNGSKIFQINCIHVFIFLGDQKNYKFECFVQGNVHKLRLQDEVGRRSKNVHFLSSFIA